MAIFDPKHKVTWMIIAGAVLAVNGAIQLTIGDRVLGIASLAGGAVCFALAPLLRARRRAQGEIPTGEAAMPEDGGGKRAWPPGLMLAAAVLVLAAAAGAFSLFKDSLAPPPLVERVSPEAKIAAWRGANPPDLRVALTLDPKSGLVESEALLAESAVVLARYLASLEQYHPPKRLPGGRIACVCTVFAVRQRPIC